jgi:hypothetical protein
MIDLHYTCAPPPVTHIDYDLMLKEMRASFSSDIYVIDVHLANSKSFDTAFAGQTITLDMVSYSQLLERKLISLVVLSSFSAISGTLALVLCYLTSDRIIEDISHLHSDLKPHILQP